MAAVHEIKNLNKKKRLSTKRIMLFKVPDS